MEFNYVESGEGHPLILIHGFCNDLTLWDGVRDAVSEHFRLITIDLPGHGNSPLPEGDITFERVADGLADWMRNEGLEHSIVIGHIMGGYVTLHLEEQHPDLVKAFGLFHSNANEDSPVRKRGRLQSIEIVKQRGMGEFVESFIPFLFFHERIEELGAEIDKATLMALNTSAATHMAFTQAMHDREGKTHLLKNDKPKLIIGGDNDTAVNFDVVFKMMQMANNVTKHVMYDTGHMGMLERPEESAKVLIDFAKSVVG